MRFPVKVIYVAGPISPGYGRTMEDNVNLAREAALEVWRLGGLPVHAAPELDGTGCKRAT